MNENKEATREEIHEAHVEENEMPDTTPAIKKAQKAQKAHKRSPKTKKVTHSHKLGDLAIGPKDYDLVLLPEKEDDPHWDPKLRNPVPEGLIDGLAEFGWDPSSRAVAIPEGDKLKIIHGKTRWRALEKANKIRKSQGLDPITAYLTVVDEDENDLDQVIKNMRLNVRLNRHVQEIDPMTLAESIYRALSTGQEEKTVAKDHAISVNDLHGYLLLMDEDKCPPPVQEMLRNGTITYAGAVEIARKAENMTKSELITLAEQVAKAAAGGVKQTTTQIKKAAGGSSEGPATKKEVKQFLLDLQSDVFTGKHGEAVTWGIIIGLEVGLGTRTLSSAKSAGRKLAHGETIRVDFKQYISDANVGKGMGDEKPVKGQDHKAKAKK